MTGPNLPALRQLLDEAEQSGARLISARSVAVHADTAREMVTAQFLTPADLDMWAGLHPRGKRSRRVPGSGVPIHCVEAGAVIAEALELPNRGGQP